MPYIERSLTGTLRTAIRQFPAVLLTGPRQSGKTTLLRHELGRSHAYVSLEPPDVRAACEADPRGFLAMHAPPVIFDEIQCAPGLLPYVKELIDADRSSMGQFVLTGSQNVLVAERVNESLAGRVAVLQLLPMSNAEAQGRPGAPLPWQTDWAPVRNIRAHRAFWEMVVRGGYPELVAHPERDAALWHSSYIQTYLERDLRTMRNVGDLNQFQAFLNALAARNGQLLNMASLGRDLGLALNTVKAWLSILEACYQVVVVRPYSANVGKRLSKTPRVYFTDTGLVCRLAGLGDPVHAMSGPMAGSLMETAVVCEVLRRLTHGGTRPEVYFWRTRAGEEVDLLVAHEGRLVPLEVKAATTPNPHMARGIARLRRDLPDIVEPGYVIHPGDVALPLASDVTALPFGQM